MSASGSAVAVEADNPDGFVVVACPEARLCGRAAERFARATAAHARPGAELAVDLAAVTSIDAAGLGALAGLARACAAAGGGLRLCRPTRDVWRLIAASGLHRAVEVFAARPAARV